MKTQKNEGEQQNNPVTRYDQKMEKRKQKAQEEARKDRIFNLTCFGIGLLFIGAIAALFATSAINKNKVIKDTYVTIGDHQITKLEYDYYKGMTVNNYVSSYGSILPYMGLDTSKDFALQQYSDTMTWKDAFDEMTVNQITNIKALSDDAEKNGFTADLSENYSEFMNNMTTGASVNGLGEAQYYKAYFGTYATKGNLEPFVRENLLVEAYYETLVERFGPSEEEITSYYEENKNNYDKVTYRKFTFNADGTEEQTAEAMQQIKVKAEEMATRRNAGEDFNQLCLEYAAEADQEQYRNTENDPSLTENDSYAYLPVSYRDWLFDESRKTAEVEVIEDESAGTYYVVEFIERTYDETTNETIKLTLSETEVSEYVSSLMEQYEVVDVAGDLVYLTIPVTADETEAVETEAEASTEDPGTDAAATESEATATEATTAAQ